MGLRRYFGIILALIILTQGIPAAAQEATLNGFDDYVNKALKDWELPGLAIAIVKNDKIVYAKGFGVRKLGDPAPVDEKTLFAIGSSSKAFTAAGIAMLVDEGKIKLDDPVTKYLPGFQLFDPYVTREITVRDLLCHRSGLERGDFIWYGTSYDRDEIWNRIRYVKPSWSFRSKFGYQNIMYLAAGQVLARVSGKSWDDFVRDRIFKPLEMTSTNTTIRAFAGQNNVATPHAKVEDKVRTIPWRNIDNIAPAGSINSNVTDMAQWVRLQLAEGSYKGARLISSAEMTEMHEPQTIIPKDPQLSMFMPDSHFRSYGLGWMLQDYKGRKVVQHGGAIDGMIAMVGMIPEEKLGVVILSNLQGQLLPTALMFRIFDTYLGGPQKDWAGEMLKGLKGLEDQGKAALKKMEESRVKGTQPSLALEKYAGTYKDEALGDAKVTLENGKLVVRTPAFVGDLEHWHYDTFRATFRDNAVGGKTMATFTLNSQAKPDALNIADLGLTFKRAADEAKPGTAIAMSEADLKKFAGKYELKAPAIEVSVEIIGGKLKAVLPGQPAYTLVPVAANRFQIEGAPEGFFVQFDVAGDRAKSLTIEQGAGPKMTLTLKQ
ncbi:MAG TPA: serine hydrolase [Blastocatellia bacterium]|nr:serine hydrolase [Blastocatellia bacterium]